MTTDDGGALILSEIERLIGTLAYNQREKALEAISEGPGGALALAKRISEDPNVNSPAAVFMGSIARGEHVKPKRTGRHTTPAPTSSNRDHRDWADRLYATKITDLRQHDTSWTDAEQREYAIDYALDHCRAAGAELYAIERELRTKHGLQASLTGDERDFERDTEHRRLMIEAYGPGMPLPWQRARLMAALADTIPGEPEPLEIDV